MNHQSRGIGYRSLLVHSMPGSPPPSPPSPPSPRIAVRKIVREVNRPVQTWIKLILHERRICNREREETLLREAIERYPKTDDLWLMYGSLMEEKDLIKTKQIYLCGLDYLGHAGPELWLAYAKIEEKLFDFNRVRSILEFTQGVFAVYQSVWLESIRFEVRCRSSQYVLDTLFTNAFKSCPRAGILLTEQIELALTIKERNGLTVAALLKTNRRCPIVMLAAARTAWMDIPLEINKVIKRLKRALVLDPMFGDAWAALYCFNQQQRQEIMKECIEKNPSRGEKWITACNTRGNEYLTTDEILKRVAMISNPNDYKIF